MKKQSKQLPKLRNINQLMHLQGTISLSEKSESLGEKKFSRKTKHKNKNTDCWSEFLIKRIDTNNLLIRNTDLSTQEVLNYQL